MQLLRERKLPSEGEESSTTRADVEDSSRHDASVTFFPDSSKGCSLGECLEQERSRDWSCNSLGDTWIERHLASGGGEMEKLSVYSRAERNILDRLRTRIERKSMQMRITDFLCVERSEAVCFVHVESGKTGGHQFGRMCF